MKHKNDIFKQMKEKLLTAFSINYNKQDSGLSDCELKTVDDAVIFKGMTVDFFAAIAFLILGIFYLVLDITTGIYNYEDKGSAIFAGVSVGLLILSSVLMISYYVWANRNKEKGRRFNKIACFVFYLLIMTTVLLFYYKDMRFFEAAHMYFFSYSIFFFALFAFSPSYPFAEWLILFGAQLFFPPLLAYLSGAEISFFNYYQTAIVILIFNLGGLLIRANNYRSAISSFQEESVNTKLKEMSYKDELTKAYNRYALSNDISKLSESCSKSEFHVIMFDIDNFKDYNDNFSHTQGDQCLSLISSSVQNLIVENGLKLYRYGGEEFVVIQEGSLQDAKKLAEDIRTTIYNLKINMPEDISKFPYVSVSVVIGDINTEHKLSVASVVKEVDESLYYSKKHGKNCCTYESQVLPLNS